MKLGKVALPIAMAMALTSLTFASSVDQKSSNSQKQTSKKQSSKSDAKDQKGVAAPAAEYGVGAVVVTRGTGAPAIWAWYSTRLGSPVGDTTGGAFRFTCNASHGSCTVSVMAAILSDGTDPVAVWPRVLMQRQSLSGGGQTYCEYGDGVDSAPFGLVTPQPATSDPTFTPLNLHIGGSADCGGPVTTAGSIAQITVPTGYYDVFSTFVIKK